jgi:hypothetical protein
VNANSETLKSKKKGSFDPSFFYVGCGIRDEKRSDPGWKIVRIRD